MRWSPNTSLQILELVRPYDESRDGLRGFFKTSGDSQSFTKRKYSLFKRLSVRIVHRALLPPGSVSSHRTGIMTDDVTSRRPQGQNNFAKGDIEEDPSASEPPSFDIYLYRTGDEGSHFRTQNDPSSPWQRVNYVERKGAVDIRCSCLDIVHGDFSPSSDLFATLLVLQFRFDTRKTGRRFQSVNIELEFQRMRPEEKAPEVSAIWPNGRLSLMPTTQHEEKTKNLNLQLGGAAPVGGLTATGTLGWQKSVSRDMCDRATVTGSIDLKGRNFGPPNSVSWTLLENGSVHTGVPEVLQTAVLLKRADENPFQCVVKIDAKVDFMSTLQRVFGGKGTVPRDDPVWFDPKIRSTENLRKYDEKELGCFRLESVCDVTFRTFLDGVVKDKGQKEE